MIANHDQPALDEFIAAAAACTKRCPEPADCVVALAPLMFGLVSRAADFLEPLHYRSDPAGYARNLIHDAPDVGL